VTAVLAFNLGTFAEEEEQKAVVVVEKNNGEKTTEKQTTEATETEIKEQKEGEGEVVKEVTKDNEEKKDNIVAQEAAKEEEVKKSTEAIEKKEEEEDSDSFLSFLNPLNWFSSEDEKNEEMEEVAKDAQGEKVEKKENPQPLVEEKKEKVDEGPSIGRVILLWLPNILLDITDIVSVDAGVGSETALEVDLTKYLGIGFAFGEKYFIQKGFSRQYGGGYSSGWDMQFLCFNTEKRYVEDTFGTTKRYYVGRKDFELADSANHTYRDKVRDFYAISVKAGWLAIINFEVHPIEIADLITSVFFIDITGDNLK